MELNRHPVRLSIKDKVTFSRERKLFIPDNCYLKSVVEKIVASGTNGACLELGAVPIFFKSWFPFQTLLVNCAILSERFNIQLEEALTMKNPH